MNRVAIITINYNNSADTIALLKSLLAQVGAGDFIYVLDNASALEDFEVLKSFVCEKSEKISLIKSDKNLGFAAGNNFVFEQICDEFKYVLFVNNDTLADENMLENLLECAQKNEVGALTGAIYCYPEKGKLWNAGGKLTWLDRKYFSQKKIERKIFKKQNFVRASFITGCLMLLEVEKIRKVLQKGKLFDERFFFGQEDFNLCVRLKRAKICVGAALEAVLYHKVSATIGEVSSNKINKNILHFAMRIVDRRNFSSKFGFVVWRAVYMILLRIKLRLGGYLGKEVRQIVRGVKKYGRGASVDKKVFEEIMRG